MKGYPLSRTHLWLLLTAVLIGSVLSNNVQQAAAGETGPGDALPASLARVDLLLAAGPMTLPLGRTPTESADKRGLLGTLWQLNWEERGFGAFPGAPESIGAREEFNAAGRRTAQIDRNGNRVDILHDEKGWPVRIEGPRGAWLEFKVDGKGLLQKAITSEGDEIHFSYRSGELSEVRVNNGPALRYAYDNERRLIRLEDPVEGSTDYMRDSRGRITTIRRADRTEERFEYDDKTGAIRHVDAKGHVTEVVRSSDGRRFEETGLLGGKTILELDESGKPVTITGPAGDVTRMDYDEQGRLNRIEECCGGSRTIHYEGDLPLLKSVIYDGGTVQKFEYDEKGNLATILDDADTLLHMTYYPDGLIKSLAEGGAPEGRFTYSADGRLHSIINPLGETTRLEYDEAGNIARQIDPLGGIREWAFDNQRRVTAFTDPAGATTGYVYNNRGLLAAIKDAAGGETRFKYDARGRLVEEKTGGGLETRYEYDGKGQLLSVTGPDGAISQFDYDVAGNPIRETNPLGGVSQASYDFLGRRTVLTDPTGGSIQFTWNDEGMLASITDPAGTKITSAYDRDRRRTAVTGPGKRATHYEYNSDGRLSKVTGATGLTTQYEYGRHGILSRIKDNHGLDTRLEYDTVGRVSREVTAAGLTTDNRYDGRGNLTGRGDNLGEDLKFEYSPAGLLVSVSDALGATVHYSRDTGGRLTERIDPLGMIRRITYGEDGEITRIVEPSGDEVRFSRDDAGRIAEVRLPGGGAVKFQRDAVGNIILRNSPLGEKVHYRYDTAGRRTAIVDGGGRTTTLAYDAAGRLIRKSYPDGRAITSQYDGNGDLVTLDDGSFPVQYEYDDQGRLSRIGFEAIGKEIRYNYGLSGLSTRYFDVAGERVERKYDVHKRIVSLGIPGAGSIAVEYDAKDRVTALLYPNGIRAEWEYDKGGRTTSINCRNRAGDTLGGRRYTYDAAGNPTSATSPDGLTCNWMYDADGRLVEERSPAGTVRYGYGRGGNRSFREDNHGRTEYRYDRADRLTRMGDTRFVYDDHGNLVERVDSGGAIRYFYNDDRMLVRVVKRNGAEIRFGYGPTGDRIWREDAAGRIWYISDENNLIAELDENLEIRSRYVHGPGIDKPLVMIRNGEHYFYHADELGTPLFLTDGKGEIVLSQQTDAFGRVITTEGDLENPFIFTGREYDVDLGMYYYRARWYDPEIGRFLTPDPAWSPLRPPPDLNTYVYARNAPTRFTDPLGRQLVFPRGFTREEVLFLRQLRIRAALESGPVDLPSIDESLNLDLLQQGGRARGEGLQILQPRYEADLRQAIRWNRIERPAFEQQWQADLRAQDPNWTEQIRAMNRAGAGDPGRSQIRVQSPGAANRSLPHGQSDLRDATLQQPARQGPGGDTRVIRPGGDTRIARPGDNTRVVRPGEGGRNRPTSSQPSNVTPNYDMIRSFTRVGGATSHALSVGTLRLRYDACRDAGHSHVECMKPTILAVGMAVSTGVIAAATLPALFAAIGVSAPVGLAVLTAAGLYMSADAFFEAGGDWARVPDNVATAAQQRGARDLVAVRAELLQGLQADLDRYSTVRRREYDACEDAHTYSDAAMEIHARLLTTNGEIAALSQNQVAAPEGEDPRCAEQKAAIAEVHNFLGRAGEMEETVTQSLEGAEGIAAVCRTRADAKKIEELYGIARRLAVQMVQDAGEIREKNLAILGMADDDLTIDANLTELTTKTEALRTDLGALGDAVSACVNARDNALAANAEAEGIAAEIRGKVSTFRAALDAGIGERGDEGGYRELTGEFARIEAELEPKRDLGRCELTGLATDELIGLKFDAEGLLSEAESALENARLSAGACAGIAGYDDLLESVESSASLAMLQVAGKEELLDRARECAGEATDDGTDIPGLDEAIDEVAGDGLVDFLAFLQLFNGAAADEQLAWESFSSYASAFEQRLRTLGAEACESQELGYVLVQAEEAIREHALILTDLVDYYSYLQGALDELGPDGEETHQIYQAALGHSGTMRSRHAAMLGQLRNDYGCDGDNVRRTGEEVAQAGADQDDIDAGVGGTSATDKEICGDRIDNNGDGNIDECEAGCCDGKVLIEVEDCGPAADDIFLIRLSTGESATTPRGASTFISRDLDPGIYSVSMHVLSAPDDLGTYCLTVTVDGAALLSASGSPSQGTVESWDFEIPGEGAVSKYQAPIIDHAPMDVMNREKGD